MCPNINIWQLEAGILPVSQDLLGTGWYIFVQFKKSVNFINSKSLKNINSKSFLKNRSRVSEKTNTQKTPQKPLGFLRFHHPFSVVSPRVVSWRIATTGLDEILHLKKGEAHGASPAVKGNPSKKRMINGD
jgi:hypothetical protein